MQIVDVRKEKRGLEQVEIIGYGATYTGYTNTSYVETTAGAYQGETVNVSEATASMSIVEKTSGGFTLQEDGYAIRSSSGAVSNSTWADGYAWAVFGTNLGGDSVVARSSYNGANITYHGEGTGVNVNGFRNRSAVGWA